MRFIWIILTPLEVIPKAFGMPSHWVGLLTGLTVIILTVSGCLFSNEPDENNEFYQGLNIAQQVEKEIGLVDNPKEIERLNKIGFAITYQIARPNECYSFNIVNWAAPNAFALPGGFSFVTKGVFDMELTDAEVAFLLGHEITHIHRGHHIKAANNSAGLSLAQFAAIILLARSTSMASNTGEAIIVSSDIMRGLLELSYSRELEMEADEYGMKYAAQAGYDPEGGVTLLQKLLDRSNQAPDSRGALLQTHPYLVERIAEAKMRLTHVPSGKPVTDSEQYKEYRRQTQGTTYARAQRLENKKNMAQAKVLYRNALQAYPFSETAIGLYSFFLQSELDAEAKKAYPMRDYSRIAQKYATIINELEKEPEVKPESLASLKKKQGEIAAEKEDEYQRAIKILDSGTLATSFLEQFSENYPQSPRIDEARFKLGECYRLSGRTNEAAEKYLEVCKQHPETVWAKKSFEGLLTILPRLANLQITYRLLQEFNDAGFKGKVVQRIHDIIKGISSLEEGGGFLKKYPDTEFTRELNEQIEVLARRVFSKATEYEGLDQLDKARENYLAIINYAPATTWAEKAQIQMKLLRYEFPSTK